VRMKVIPNPRGFWRSSECACIMSVINVNVLPARMTTVIDVIVFKVVLNCFILCSVLWTFPSQPRGADRALELGFHFQIFNDNF